MKKYLISVMTVGDTQWVSVDVFKARNAAGAIAQFGRVVRQYFPEVIAVKAEEK